MSSPIIGNLTVDSVDDVARVVAVRIARLTRDDAVGYVLVDRLRNVRLLRPSMRDADAILRECSARELVGTYTKTPASAALVERIAGDLAEALR